MKLEELERHWNEFGRSDPMWAILTDGSKAGNRWDAAEFFERGWQTVTQMLRRVDELGFPLARERALDFGCGIGRLTQALAEAFFAADGVDIAESMIDGARRYNRHGDRVAYHVNKRGDLSLFDDDSFDLVYSRLVLQHIHPLHSLKFVLEFLRVVRPHGLVVFQLPSRALPPPVFARAAYAAELVPSSGSLIVEAGEKVSIGVVVRNASPLPWPKAVGGRETCVRLGNHWLSPAGVPVAIDDGRVVLPCDLVPGESVELELAVTAPTEPGSYVIELDLVQEGVCWFAQRGSRTVRLPAEVRSETGDDSVLAGASAGSAFVPRMEMHRVAEPIVRGVLEAAGARALAVDRADGGGHESCTYFATK